MMGINNDLVKVEQTLWILLQETGVPAYDFSIDRFFPCSRPWDREGSSLGVSRIGAIADYDGLYEDLNRQGVQLVNSPEEHLMASQLSRWYPMIEKVTPRSRWFSSPPSAKEILTDFEWPVFIKGDRQTSRHQKALAIPTNEGEYQELVARYLQDSVLHWQMMVVREFVPLRPIGVDLGDRIPGAYEFRTFWWFGELVGEGAYYREFLNYSWTESERKEALKLAKWVVETVQVPFLVVDLAMTASGEWIVIELNDAQESGYGGVSPFKMWQSVIDLERGRKG